MPRAREPYPDRGATSARRHNVGSVTDFFERSDLTLEVGGALELLVHGCESEIRDLIGQSQLFEDDLADVFGSDFSFAGLRQCLCPADDSIDRVCGDRPIGERRLDTPADLAGIERLDKSRTLAYEDRGCRPLIRGEPIPAHLTGATSPDRRVPIGRTGVDHPGVIGLALGTLHSDVERTRLPILCSIPGAGEPQPTSATGTVST